jgi:hypothetical protein
VANRIPGIEVFSKAFYEARDGIREDLKRLDYWCSQKRTSPQHYQDGRHWFILELKIYPGRLGANELRAAIAIECSARSATNEPRSTVLQNCAGEGPEVNSDRDGQVLVDNIELSESVQSAAATTPSRVNLGLQEKLERFGPHRFYVSLSSREKIIASFARSWELQPLMLLSTIDTNHLPCQVVHSAGKVVNCISSEQWKALGRFAGVSDDHSLLDAAVSFNSNLAWIGLHPRLDNVIKVSDVFVGPFDLEPSA